MSKLVFICSGCGQLWKLLHMRTCRYWIEKSKVVVKWQCKKIEQEQTWKK